MSQTNPVCLWESGEGKVWLRLNLASVCLLKGGEADRWRWRKSKTCRSTLRTSPHSEQLLSESWRHCGALSTPSPTEAPVHAKQAELSLATLFRPFLSLYITGTSLFSPRRSLYIQINFKLSRGVCSVVVTTHTNTKHRRQWDNFMVKNISRTEADNKRKIYCTFFLQIDFCTTRCTQYSAITAWMNWLQQ